MDQFLKVSNTLREQIFTTIENFHLTLGSKFDNAAFVKQVGSICHNLQEEMATAGALGGLLLDLNLYNLWTLLKNYKNKQRASVANMNPCAFVAPFITKHLIERMLFSMDRIFWTAPCSGVVLPKSLSCAMFRLSMDVRKKTTGNCKFSGCGRKQLMSFARDTIDCFEQLQSKGQLTPKVQLFLKLHFPTININKIMEPVMDCCDGRAPNYKLMNVHWLQSRGQYRCSFLGWNKEGVENDPLVIVDDCGYIRADMCDLSPFLHNPECAITEGLIPSPVRENVVEDAALQQRPTETAAALVHMSQNSAALSSRLGQQQFIINKQRGTVSVNATQQAVRPTLIQLLTEPIIPLTANNGTGGVKRKYQTTSLEAPSSKRPHLEEDSPSQPAAGTCSAAQSVNLLIEQAVASLCTKESREEEETPVLGAAKESGTEETPLNVSIIDPSGIDPEEFQALTTDNLTLLSADSIKSGASDSVCCAAQASHLSATVDFPVLECVSMSLTADCETVDDHLSQVLYNLFENVK